MTGNSQNPLELNKHTNHYPVKYQTYFKPNGQYTKHLGYKN